MSPDQRRGGGQGDGGRPWWASEDPTSENTGDGEAGTPSGRTLPHDRAEVCAACPLCSLLRAVEGSRPEAVAHLIEAARQLSLAAKLVLDAHLEGYPGADRLERIPVDED